MCEQTMQVATMEDGSAAVYLPVENWRDVKAVRTEPDMGNAVRVLLADDQVRIYGAAAAMMVGVCLDFLSEDEKRARDQAETEAVRVSTAELHAPRVAEAQAHVDQAADQAKVITEAAEDEQRLDVDAETRARAEQRLADAEDALRQAEAARDDALKGVEHGE